MKIKADYKKMYHKANAGITDVIEMLHSNLTQDAKISHAIRMLVSTAQTCEDIYIDTTSRASNILFLEKELKLREVRK